MNTNRPEEKEAMNKDANLPGEEPGAGMEILNDAQLDDVSGGRTPINITSVGKDTTHRIF